MSRAGRRHPTDDAGLTLEGQRDDVQVLRDHVGAADAVLAMPAGQACCAVLVLAGSSGRIDEARVRLLARAGAVALGLRWFGGAGQPPGIYEVTAAPVAAPRSSPVLAVALPAPRSNATLSVEVTTSPRPVHGRSKLD